MTNERGNMEDKQSDILRNMAHEIIIQLMNGNRISAIKLLRDHCDAAMKKLSSKEVENEQ